MSRSVLGDLGAGFNELFDARMWVNGAKAAGGGAAAILATGMFVSKVPVVRDQKPMLKSVIRAALSVLGGTFARKYVGDAVASGIVGGGAGYALAQIVNGFLPTAPGQLFEGALGGYGFGALTAEERALLSDVPGGSIGEVSVEEGIGEVGVEDSAIARHAIHGLDDATMISALT